MGPSTLQVVEQHLDDRSLYQFRLVQVILRIGNILGTKRLEAACTRALYFGDIRYRQIKNILNSALDCEPLPEAQLPLLM